ncbi:MAG: hypothetical protein ACTH6N_02665 [Brachybacterium tyrofermentans]|uniref:hypothetical protein n=1 Tax=Brachybacterium tyrofermentans TaxID=47848 RepID=UPI00186621C5|nr:hypothetical protein [Brachybacterium tyrofermentans]
MAKQLKVIAACVVVNVGGQERYLYKGAVLPSSVERKDITRLKNTGLVAEVEVAVPEADSAADVAAAEKAAAEKAAAEKAAAAKAAADQGKADKAAGNGGAPAQK